MAVRKLASSVTHERLDDEVIAINLETGAYYALDDTAADCWTLLVGGVATDDIVATLCERYAVDADTARRDLDAFTAELEGDGLLLPDDAPPSAIDGALPPVAERRAYVVPVVNKFDDLEELLLLDPIHEVDDVGWPVARQ
jgi:hypothetical protein